jgi:glycosyltransferase involved in cell wall biosynthesis
MRIVFAIKALDDIKGGAERVLTDITAGLAEQGHHVVVLSFDAPKGKSFYPLHKKVKRLPLGIGNIKRKATFSEVISRMTAIRKAAVKLEPDVVVAFMHSTFIPASFAMIGTGVPIIASEHIVPDHYRNRRWEYVLLWLSRFFVKKITVLSESIIQSYSPALRSKMLPIANPVQPAEKMAHPAGEGDEQKLILNVGRLTEQKDQETLIRAFALLADDYPDWNVRIVGDGEFRQKLEKTVKDSKLENRIFLPGTTSAIGQEYQKAHIFALPSKYESFGLATAEAMSHGLPTIGFQACPGTNELITNGENGLLVSGNDRVRDFANGLKALMDSPVLREELGKKGLESIARFHPNAIVKQWEEVIRETCN